MEAFIQSKDLLTSLLKYELNMQSKNNFKKITQAQTWILHPVCKIWQIEGEKDISMNIPPPHIILAVA